MKKTLGSILISFCCCWLCSAQQVVSSGGYTKQSEASVDWIIGGSLTDLIDFDLSEQIKPVIEPSFFLNVYPNPASDLLNIEITSSDTSRMSLEVLDIQGCALIFKNSLKEPLIQLDIRNFADGIYYLKMTQLNDDHLFRIEKIIKIKD